MKNTILELINTLNKATAAYDAGNPYMKDTEWDKMYFQLKEMEDISGIIYPHSPTQSISYEVVNKLEKVTHSHPMLSLAKTKSEKEIYDFIGGKEHIAMLKMDGLTCSLTYQDGKLVAAETRGNGIVGENILHNALVLPSIPKTIGMKEEVIVDGEIISTYTNFKKWEDKYANPRNFAAGSIRLLDSQECAERGLTFVAWDRINAPEETMSETFRLLDSLGFEVVPYLTNDFNIEALKVTANICSYPIDGLVVKYNDRKYGESLGRTSHHFNNGIAFKFGDDSATSTLTGIDYEVSRNGILTPVAVFEEIELEGSTVSRASLHNLSIRKELLGIPYIGQEVEVVKQNMIIPQIISAVKRCPEDFNEDPSTMILLPTLCPVCGEPLEIVCENESEVLMCKNLNCSCRIINQLDYFCGKKGLDIKGLSKATLEKLLNWGWINSLSDIFELKNHRDEWIRKPGFGPKSVDNILNAIEAGKECEWTSYLAAFGIPLIGPNVIKELTKYFNSWDEFIAAIDNNFDFYNLPTFGYEKHKALHSYNYEEAKSLLEKHIIFKAPEVKEVVTTADSVSLEGKTFVVTGKLTHFKNRSELENKIAANGGKVTSSVSKKTNYLINNDFNSDSAKNRAAKAAGIPIVTEEEFINLFGIM